MKTPPLLREITNNKDILLPKGYCQGFREILGHINVYSIFLFAKDVTNLRRITVNNHDVVNKRDVVGVIVV
jgi:hypothetical protein